MRPDSLCLTDAAPGVPRSHWAIASLEAERIGAAATAALTDELETWPKPGLVSLVDCGSHHDMDCGTFRCSIDALTPFWVRLAEAGAAGADMAALRAIGLRAETVMLAATGGINTHRGAIFALGLFCAAAGAAGSGGEAPDAKRLSEIVRARWGADILRGPVPSESNGGAALRRFGAGGARAEAVLGFPHAVTVGLPALAAGRRLAGEAAARVNAFFALLAAVEDTNLLHRGGPEGLAFARASARDFMADGGVGQPDWLARAQNIHQDFVARRLSPGGSADLLAVTLFLDRIAR